MNKHNQKPRDMFNKQDVTAYLTYIIILNFHFENGFWNVKSKIEYILIF